MSYELAAILFVGLALAFMQAVALVIAVRGFREMSRIQKAVAGLVVQESEKIQQIVRA